MMRSIVCGQSCVCRVAKTRWPVSAAVRAIWIVSRSRISPMRITSGSCRRAERRATGKPLVSLPTSRWLTTQRLCVCRNSIGSSMVTMWSDRVSLISSMIAASVVDLPEPVGPVTRTNPRGLWQKVCRILGKPQLVDGLDVDRDEPESRRERALVEEHVHPEAGLAVERVGEIDLPVGLELLPLVLVQDAVDELARFVGRQLRIAFEILEMAVDPHHRRQAHRQMEVRRFGLNYLSKDLA